jgi:hypothetical protein
LVDSVEQKLVSSKFTHRAAILPLPVDLIFSPLQAYRLPYVAQSRLVPICPLIVNFHPLTNLNWGPELKKVL